MDWERVQDYSEALRQAQADSICQDDSIFPNDSTF